MHVRIAYASNSRLALFANCIRSAKLRFVPAVDATGEGQTGSGAGAAGTARDGVTGTGAGAAGKGARAAGGAAGAVGSAAASANATCISCLKLNNEHAANA